MRTLIFGLLTFGCFVVSCDSSANAQDLERLFSRLDKNGDGVIDQDEMPEQVKQRILNRDSDGDGKISREEMLAGMDAKKNPKGGEQKKRRPDAGRKPDQANSTDRFKQLLKRLDKNGNGKLELSEVPEMLRERLSKLDKDGDGTISQEEMKAAAGAMGDRAGGKQPGDKKANPNGNQSNSRFEALMGKLPRTETGQVDLEAIENEGQRERLSQFDTNGDRRLDKEELKAIADKFNRQNQPGQPRKGKDAKKLERGSERSPQLPKRPEGSSSEEDNDDGEGDGEG